MPAERFLTPAVDMPRTMSHTPNIMSRIAQTFQQLKSSSERALIPYLTAGFPHPANTLGLLHALCRGGADIIELGVPFSDPVADGPTIQAASHQALDAGMTLTAILEVVREFRRDSQVPVVLFGAYNPFFHYGIERLARDAAQAGADALLIADLPVEESPEVRPLLQPQGLDLISLVAPTTSTERMAHIASHSSGFLYYISVKGVTGARQAVHFSLEEPLRQLRSVSELPVAVGFGIATPEQAAEVGACADAVVVGSALIDLISRHRGDAQLELRVEHYMRAMKEPLRRPARAKVP